jgi:hypothetical protein
MACVTSGSDLCLQIVSKAVPLGIGVSGEGGVLRQHCVQVRAGGTREDQGVAGGEIVYPPTIPPPCPVSGKLFEVNHCRGGVHRPVVVRQGI